MIISAEDVKQSSTIYYYTNIYFIEANYTYYTKLHILRHGVQWIKIYIQSIRKCDHIVVGLLCQSKLLPRSMAIIKGHKTAPAMADPYDGAGNGQPIRRRRQMADPYDGAGNGRPAWRRQQWPTLWINTEHPQSTGNNLIYLRLNSSIHCLKLLDCTR